MPVVPSRVLWPEPPTRNIYFNRPVDRKKAELSWCPAFAWEHMVQQPTQCLYVAVTPIHPRQTLPHCDQCLRSASVPRDCPFDPVRFVKYAVRPLFAAALPDSSPKNRNLTRRVNDKFAPVTGGAVVLENHIITDGQVLARQKLQAKHCFCLLPKMAVKIRFPAKL